MLTHANGDSYSHGMRGRGGLLHGLLKLTNRLTTPFSTYLEHHHRISVNEFRLLMTIGTLGGSASHELAEMTGVNVMSVSRAVATLRRDGRIEVKRDPANHRRKCLTLSAEGERLFAIMQPQTEKVAEYLFSGLSEEDVTHLGDLVSRLIATLEARDEEGRPLLLERTKPDNDTE